MILLLASLLSSTLIGYLTVRVLLPVYRPVWADATLKICLGAGVGVGISSCVYFLARLVVGPARIAGVISELVILAGAAAAFRFRRETFVVDKPAAKPAWWAWLLLTALLVSFAIAATLFADSSAANPYGAWDAWSIWNLRARFLAQPDATWTRAFSPVLSYITHPEYPMLLTGYVARCWTAMGAIGDVAAPIATAALFSVATVGLLVSTLAILRGFSTAMIGGIVLLGTTGFLANGSWQYADVPLAFYYLAAFAGLFLADALSQRGRIVVLAGIAAGFAAWTKDEGMLFALLLSLAFIGYLVIVGNQGRWRKFGAFAVGLAAPIAIVLLFRLVLAPAIPKPVTLAGAAHQLAEGGRYLQIAKAFWNEGDAHPVISLLVLAACLGISRDRVRQPVMIASSLAWLAMFVAYFFAYVVTPMDLTWHLGTSLGRLYVQLWPSLIFLSLAAMRTAEEAAPQPQEVVAAAGKKARGRAAVPRRAATSAK